MIKLFESDETHFISNGLGPMSETLSCVVKEELNGEFELEMTYPITGKRFKELSLRQIILAKPNPFSNEQAFRIYSISKPINCIVTINAEHISYDLSGHIIQSIEETDLQSALALLKNDAIPPLTNTPFYFSTDITSDKKISVTSPSSIRNILGKAVVDIFECEYVFDNYSVMSTKNRGKNRNVTLRYGKNLIDLKQDENCKSLYTGVFPYWSTNNGDITTLPEKYVTTGDGYLFDKILPLDLSRDFPNAPTEIELRDKANDYIIKNKIGIPTISLTVSFLLLSESAEYKQYEQLSTIQLGDHISVEFPELKVNTTAKCISTTYDALEDKYTSLDLGDPETRLSSTISKGLKGPRGDAGNGIITAETLYQSGASGTNAPAGVWSVEIPIVPEGHYLWTKTTTSYTDKSTTIAYSVGALGSNGEDAYAVDIISSHGNIFKNGVINTTLRAIVYEGKDDITDSIDANRFRWTRTSNDSADDIVWNSRYFGGTKQITITRDDVNKRASFTCNILRS